MRVTMKRAESRLNRAIKRSGLTKAQWYVRIYLKSDHWLKLRARKLKSNPTCERCPNISKSHVHHVNYRFIFDVTIRDLLTLCDDCHRKEHGISPRNANAIRQDILTRMRQASPAERPAIEREWDEFNAERSK